MYYHNHTICYSDNTGWCRNVGCLIILGHVLQKSPKISDSFAERDLQLKASYAFSLLCNTICYYHDHTILKPMILILDFLATLQSAGVMPPMLQSVGALLPMLQSAASMRLAAPAS